MSPATHTMLCIASWTQARPARASRLFHELGEANVFMRGVLHILNAEQRKRVAANLRDLIGQRGVVYFAETNYTGDPLGQLAAQGAMPLTVS